MEIKINPRLYLGDGNKKLIGSNKVVFKTWALPAIATCPEATTLCKNICYAKVEETRYKDTRECRLRNLAESEKDTFVEDMINLLEKELIRKKHRNKVIFVRIHTSGDFYNFEYFTKWVNIANHFIGNKRIFFQAYTKSINFLQHIDPKEINIKFVYSIMSDTNPQHIEMAVKLGLSRFEAKHASQILQQDNVCGGICGPCLKCYVGRKPQSIVVETHGIYRNKAK